MALTFAVGVGGTVAFIVLRWAIAAHRELSRFVVAGSAFANHATPRFLYVFPHSKGYDGQFYWRLAVDPAQLGRGPFDGVRFDAAYRTNRIVYSALAWALSLGHAPWVALGLVLANVVAIAGLLSLALRATRRAGLGAGWSLCALAVPGVVGALSRDLTEALAATLVVAGVMAFNERRYLWSAAAWSLAVLTREEMLAGVAAYAGLALWQVLRRRRGLALADVVWVVPVVAFVGWQLVVHAVAGYTPALSSTGSGDFGAPFVGFVTALPQWFRPHTWHQDLKGALYVVQTIAVVWLLVVAWRRRHGASGSQLAVLAMFVLLLICETRQGWVAPLDARYATVPMSLAWLQLLEGRARAPIVRAATVVVPVAAATLLWRVAVI